MTRILVTTTSFQDTPGEHHQVLADTGWEIVTARGPLTETDTLAAVVEFGEKRGRAIRHLPRRGVNWELASSVLKAFGEA